MCFFFVQQCGDLCVGKNVRESAKAKFILGDRAAALPSVNVKRCCAGG